MFNNNHISFQFDQLTETFLPPDPPVERPHLAFGNFRQFFSNLSTLYSEIPTSFFDGQAYDAYKYREIMEAIETHREDVLAYGYFTTDNTETAQLIANSTFSYVTNPPTMYA